MDSNCSASPAVAWPLAGSLVLTGAVAAFVCTPPIAPLHSWGQIFSLATAYVLVAAIVHSLAVWSVCRIREEDEPASWPIILSIIWAVWLVVVWLPLLVLLTAERSPLVAAVLPLTTVFAVLLIRWHAAGAATDLVAEIEVHRTSRTLLQLEDSPHPGRALLPAAGTALAIELGLLSLGANHVWTAGCIFGAGAIYPMTLWLNRTAEPPAHAPRSHRVSTGNSVVVWLLIVLSLVPLMAKYAAGALNALLHVQVRHPVYGPPSLSHQRANGYVGVILVTPPTPHEIITPSLPSTSSWLRKPQIIPFDGIYWYFKAPDTRPGPSAHIVRGDPSRNRVFSTDTEPLTMEAHQHLAQTLSTSCCRSLRVDVRNADTVSGAIHIEVLLRNFRFKSRPGEAQPAALSLGTQVLRSSTITPMPLKRPPLDDSVTFPIPAVAHGRTFNEVIVRIKPDRTRSLAGAQVAIRDLALEP